MNKLYVVATPIGNMKDISERAIETLTNVSCILAEDTKHTSPFLAKLGIKKRLVSLHKFNEVARVEEVMKILEEGDVALVSDAGTPTISDPGQVLISRLVENQVEVNVIPGPTAVAAALSVSGLLFENFTFIGFMPRKEGQIKNFIETHNNSDVLIAYESPNRINKTIEILESVNPNMKVTVARELTKMYEEVQTGTPSEMKEKEFRGEIVLMISEFKLESHNEVEYKIDLLVEEGLSNKSIINYLTKTEYIKKNVIYERLKKYGK